MKYYLSIVFLMVVSIVGASEVVFATDTRQVINIDFDWKYQAGDIKGAQQAAFPDADWASTDLPHDWTIEGEYAKDNPSGGRCGYLPTGVLWYRKALELPADWSGKRVAVKFDSVFMNSTVWLNGQQLGVRPYGYLSFSYDLTDHLVPGKNILAVRVDNTPQPSGRWYTGTGIFGHVDLVGTNPVHLEGGNIFFRTVEADKTQATVEVTTEYADAQGVTIRNELVDGSNAVVAMSESPALEGKLVQSLSVSDPHRWSLDDPHLYTLRTTLISGGEPVDQIETRVGIRTLSFNAKTGFQLNGRSLKMKGVCEHHDGGPVGGAFPRKVLRERIALLKTMGCNAIRTAHNPRTQDFYELCDELGMMVMDEIFDGWHQKAEADYGARFFAQWWKQDVESWVRTNRNHPCIVMYSIGNETGHEDAYDITGYIKKFDSTRPTTGGTVYKGVDIQGYNGPGGVPGSMQKFHKDFPNEICVRTEVPHTLQTRGFYRVKTWWRDKRKPRNVIPEYGSEQIFFDGHPRYSSNYDNCGVRISARTSWRETRDMPWIIGEFRWTGFDYIGEAAFGGGKWPARIWNFGIIDLAGLPKDHFWFYQSQWTDEPMVHVLPHWTHRFLKPGTIVPVVAYSNCDTVELFLNDESLGKKTEDPEWLEFVWKVPYAAGELKAVGYVDGKPVAEKKWVTSGSPVQLRLETNNNELAPDRRDTATVTVSALDKNGDIVPWAMNRVEFKIEGPVKNLGFENGDPVDVTQHRVNHRNLFYGYARGFFQATANSGDIGLTAASILGDTVFKTKQTVAIDVRKIQLRGNGRDSATEIRYTTDGSEPKSGKVYKNPLEIEQTTLVRAVVMRDGNALLELEQEFVKGTRPPVTDRRWGPQANEDPAKPGKKRQKPFSGPFDKQVVGKWQSKVATFDFMATGELIKRGKGSPSKSKRGFWWYDYPDDVFEDVENAGSGSIRWRGSGGGNLEFQDQSAAVLEFTEGNRTWNLTREESAIGEPAK